MADLRRKVFALVAEEARRRMARRQAHRVMLMEAVHVGRSSRIDGGG